MTVTAKCLIEAQFAAAVDTTHYTTPSATRTIVDKFTATNTDSGSNTISINIVPSGSGASISNIITKTVTIAAGATYDATEMKNQILNAGDVISCAANTALKIVIRASGREVT